MMNSTDLYSFNLQDQLDMYSKWAKQVQNISENLNNPDYMLNSELQSLEIWIRREWEKLKFYTIDFSKGE